MTVASKGHAGFHGLLAPATVILLCACALTVLGITILFSASLPVNEREPYGIVLKQGLWICVTLVVGFLVTRVDLESARKYIWFGYALCLALLVAVLVPSIGHYVNGSRSWIRFGPFGFQVAEFAKIGVVFMLAHYFSVIRQENVSFVKGFIVPCVAVGLVVGLILLQPDLGTALILSISAFCLLYLAGSRLVYIVPSAVAGLAAVAYLIHDDRERWSRLTSFLDMEGQKGADAYQVWQAILAFGAGGSQGVGLGNGRQQLNFLPEAHNDFIFAIVGEELGLAATLAVVVVFSILFAAGVIHVRRAPNAFQYLLAWGCLLLVSVQAAVNLGVVTGLLPTTGLPLPFISYGGSNFLTMGICVAVLVNTSVAWRNPAIEQSKRKLKEIA